MRDVPPGVAKATYGDRSPIRPYGEKSKPVDSKRRSPDVALVRLKDAHRVDMAAASIA